MQQLERESEQLDESFQAYLRRQKNLKQQMNSDVTQIWKNYNFSKAALEQFETINPKLIHTTNIDFTLDDKVTDDDDLLKDLHEIRQLRSPQLVKQAFSQQKVLNWKNQISNYDLSPPKTVLLNVNDSSKENGYENDIKTNPIGNIHEEMQNITSPKRVRPAMSDLFSTSTPLKDSAASNRMAIDTKTSHPIGVFRDEDRKSEHSNKKATSNIEEPKISDSPNVAESTLKEIVHQSPSTEINQKSMSKNMIHQEKNPQVQKHFSNGVPTINQRGVNMKESLDEIPMEKSTLNEPIASTSKLQLPHPKINGFFDKSSPMFTKLSSIESGDDTSDQISIGPAHILNSDDFWI